MHRFFTDGRGITGGMARLSDEDARHAMRVLRLKAGEEIELVDESGRYLAVIDSAEEDGVQARVTGALRSTEARARVTLYQGLPKADKMEWIVQKSTELGACAVQPVAMERSVVRLDARDGARKAERWQKIAREAVKQCARMQAPLVGAPRRLTELLEEMRGLDLLIVPWEDARDGSVRACVEPLAGLENPRIGILIGPEGGISPEEAQLLSREAGGRLVTLGPRILRTETAGLCTLTMVMTLLGELE